MQHTVVSPGRHATFLTSCSPDTLQAWLLCMAVMLEKSLPRFQ